MSPATRIIGAFLVTSALALGATATVSFAQAGVITGCVASNGALRVATDGCRINEQAISWNVQGPAGPAGPAGPTGPEGPAGRDGRDGRDATTPPPPPTTVTGTLFISDFGSAVPIMNFSLGATNTGTTGGGGGGGRVIFSEFNISKLLDGYSVPLLQAASNGEHLRTGRIEMFESGGTTPFATYVMDDILVVSDQFSAGGPGVFENVSFQFARIHTTIVLNGTTYASCWDVVRNARC
jgi:type VI protein secretion system component Hcp